MLLLHFVSFSSFSFHSCEFTSCLLLPPSGLSFKWNLRIHASSLECSHTGAAALLFFLSRTHSLTLSFYYVVPLSFGMC